MNDQPSPYVPETFGRSGPSLAPHFVNRTAELRLISTWAADVDAGSIFAIIGIGGIGKTALASMWLANEAKSVAQFQGCLWWSFYEEAAARFFIECFSYLTGTPVTESVALPLEVLLAGITRRVQEGKFLLVLDGLEREMNAYSTRAGTGGGVPITSHSMRGLEPAMASLLHSCGSGISASKILLMSRLAPVDLEDAGGNPLAGVTVLQLGPLEETAARQFFSSFAIEQSAELMELAQRYQFHPLLLSLLAHRMTEPMAREQRPGAVPFLSLGHLIEASIGELRPEDRIVAEQIAAFDGQVYYADLVSALVGQRFEFVRESELDQSLSRLQNFGLINWNQSQNTYTTHPVIRSALRQNRPPLPTR